MRLSVDSSVKLWGCTDRLSRELLVEKDYKNNSHSDGKDFEFAGRITESPLRRSVGDFNFIILG